MTALAATLLTLLCYGLAAYLGWQQRNPIYALALLGGHLAALASPLWRLLYGVSYSPDLASAQLLLSQPVPWPLLIGSAWYYPLPALVVLFLYSERWWFPGLLTGLLTFGVFGLYHLLIETIGLRSEVWAYRGEPLPLGLSSPLLAAAMSGLISYALLYLLAAAMRFSWLSMAALVVPAPLALSLLVHGLLGAPLWLTTLLDAADWALAIGAACTLGLLAWAVQIVTAGVARLRET